MKERVLFLDLEGTIIDDAWSLNIMSDEVNDIVTFIEAKKIDRIVIWSFACFEQKDVKKISDVLDFRPFLVPVSFVTVEEMMILTAKKLHLSLMSMDDFFDFNTKETALIHCLDTIVDKGSTSWLVDDTVTSMMVQIDCRILHVINVADLGE